MTVPRSVADVLDEHVTLKVESIDRMYCNVYVPTLQHVNGVVWFFRGHRGELSAPHATHRHEQPQERYPVSPALRSRFVHAVPPDGRDGGRPRAEAGRTGCRPPHVATGPLGGSATRDALDRGTAARDLRRRDEETAV